MRTFKKILFSFFIILLVLFSAAWVISRLYEGEIKSYIVSAINKNLKTPVNVKDIRFSVIRKFPYASVEFREVLAMDAWDKPVKDTLFYSKKIFLLFNLFDVFSKDYSIRKISIEKAKLYMKRDEKGNVNYDLIKKDSASAPGNSQLKLNEVTIEESETRLNDHVNKRYVALSISKGTMKGEFSSGSFTLSANADGMMNKFISGETKYADHKPISLKLELAVNNQTKEYHIQSSEMKMAGINLDVSGTVTGKENGSLLDLSLKSKSSKLDALLSLLPGVNLNSLKDYSYDGSVYFTTTIKGMAGEHVLPKTEMNFGTENAVLKLKSNGMAIRNIKFKGYFTNLDDKGVRKEFLSLKNVSASLDNQSLNGDLEIKDFANPVVKARVNANVNLATLSHFYLPDTLESMNGNLLINAAITGRNSESVAYASQGTVKLNNVSFKFKKKPARFQNLSGLFQLTGNELKFQNMTGKISTSDFALNGTLTNLISFLFQKNQTVSLDASLSSDQFILDEMMEREDKESANDTVTRLTLSKQINMNVTATIQHFKFRKFEAEDVHGNITLQNQQLKTNILRFNSMDGIAELKGGIDASRNDSILIAYDATVTSLDIKKLFYEMGDFGQTVITDKNVKGNVTATVQFASIWSSDLVCNTDKMYAKAKLNIENGALINFEPTKALSKFVKGSDLDNITFSKLNNEIEIKNRKIYFPEMEINSSALNLTASGVHSFDNMVDYKIKMLLSDLLGKKVKEQNTEFGTIEDDGSGKSSIFLSMKGPMKNPKITWDRKATEQKIETDIKNEKQNLKNVMSKEFGWYKKDTLDKKQPQKENKKEELEIDFDEPEK